MHYLVYKDCDNIDRVVLFDNYSISEMIDRLELLQVVSGGNVEIGIKHSDSDIPYIHINCYQSIHDDTIISREDIDAVLIRNKI